ncbi:hypothetical protein BC332_30296 [Capsicum chinense]|nr:hypothetical protein BC332_30296 [Capsicum chinense]
MVHNDKNSQLRATLNDILGLEKSDSLLHDKNSYDGYDDSPNRYLDSDDEDLQNLIDEEMNRSHQSDQDKYLSISDGEEYDHQEDGVDEEEGTIHDDSYTDNQYTAGPIVEKCKKDGGQIKYVTFGCGKSRKPKARNKNKRVDCKARVNCHVMNDDSCAARSVILEHNHKMDPALSHFLPCHMKLSRTLKRSLVAHDIAGRPSKSIRLLEVEVGGPE